MFYVCYYCSLFSSNSTPKLCYAVFFTFCISHMQFSKQIWLLHNHDCCHDVMIIIDFLNYVRFGLFTSPGMCIA